MTLEPPTHLPLAELIASARQQRSLSLSAVAREMQRAAQEEGTHCGATRQAILGYERGRIPHPDALRWLASAIGLPVDELATAARQQRSHRRAVHAPPFHAFLSELPDYVVIDTRALFEALGTATPAQCPGGLEAVADLHPTRISESAGYAPKSARHHLETALTYHWDIESATMALSDLAKTDLGSSGSVMPFSMGALSCATRDWLVDLHRRPNGESRPSDPFAQAIRDTFRAFQELDTRYGGGHARLALVQYLAARVIPELTVGNQAVQEAGAELLYLAGLMTFDEGALGLAERYLVQSLRFASEAASPTFAANVVAAMSHLAVFIGDGEGAIRLAQAGLTGMRAAESPPVRMRLLTMKARGRAITGDSAGCASDLSGAEGALEETTSETADWTRFLNRAFLAGEMSQCFRDLHQARQAEHHALESILASVGRGRRRALSQTTLAASYLQQGELEQACTAGAQAVDLLGGGIRSTRVAHELRWLARGMESYGTHPAVGPFRDRVSELLS